MAEIINHGRQAFPHYEEDTTFVFGRLAQDGENLPAENYLGYASLSHRDPIAPGRSREVPVHLLTRDLDKLPVGTYTLTVALMTLELSHESTIRIRG